MNLHFSYLEDMPLQRIFQSHGEKYHMSLEHLNPPLFLEKWTIYSGGVADVNFSWPIFHRSYDKSREIKHSPGPAVLFVSGWNNLEGTNLNNQGTG